MSVNVSAVREAWVSGQKNTFTKWANNYLARKRITITDLYEDLRDGIVLISLLQVISGEKVATRYVKKPKMRIQKMENLNLAFNFMQKKGLTLTNIGSSDILDGNNKLVLGLLWTIINKFQVTAIDVDGVSGKDGLLLWCQRSLSEYSNISMTNFTTSWTDGLAFCGLIHRFHPHLIDYEALSAENAESNVSTAFRTAEEKLKIPQLLEVGDIAGNPKPDEKIVVTYVSLLFQEFASGVQKKKAVTTIARAISIAQRHEALKTAYTDGAKDLLGNYEKEMATMSPDMSFGNLETIKEALDNFYQYKKHAKPLYDSKFVELESCAGRWTASCHNNNRPVPQMSPPLEELQEKRKRLDELEIQYERRLKEDFERFESMEFILQRVKTGLVKLNTWLSEKEALFVIKENEKSITSTNDVEARLENVAYFEEHELPRNETLLTAVQTTASDLSNEHSEAPATQESIEQLSPKFEQLRENALAYKTYLDEQLNTQKQLDQIAKECNVLIRTIHFTLDELLEEIEAPISCSSVNAAQAAKLRFENELLPNTEALIEAKHTELKEKIKLLGDAGRVVTFPGFTVEKTQSKVDRLIQSRDKHQQVIQTAIEANQRQDTMFKEFAELAAAVKQGCDGLTRAIKEETGTIEEQLKHVQNQHQLYKATTDYSEETLGMTMQKLEDVNSALDAEHVFNNPYTSDTIQSLRALYTSLGGAMVAKIEALEKEITLQKAGNLTPEQLAEIQEVFSHFDADEDGVLSSHEFIPACKAIGLTLSDDELHDVFLELDDKERDEINFGQFSKFCASQLESGSTEEDVLAAFQFLAKESAIAMELVEEYFEPDMVEYMNNNMPTDPEQEDFKDYTTFTTNLFQL